MQMRRAWVVCDGFLGTPILVERCPTMAAAYVGRRGGGAAHSDPGKIATARLVSQTSDGDNA
jgi:hypothetical protein